MVASLFTYIVILISRFVQLVISVSVIVVRVTVPHDCVKASLSKTLNPTIAPDV